MFYHSGQPHLGRPADRTWSGICVPNNWTVKFEYDYLGFGAKNIGFTSTCPSCGTIDTSTQNVSADKHIFKVGLNYLFNMAGPVVAKY